MSEISKIYKSTEFLFKVGSRKGKTRKQINAMIDRQRPKKKVKKRCPGKRKPKPGIKFYLSKDSLTLSEAKRVLNVNKKQLDKMLNQGLLQLVAGRNLELWVTTASIKRFISQKVSDADINNDKNDSTTTTNPIK
jgi:pyruvate kinase